MRSLHSISRKLFVLFAVLSSKKFAGCNPITNSDLNDHIRKFSPNDSINSTGIKTLQKEESGRYANVPPAFNPVRFKDASDSALSSTSYSRGLLHHDHPGYTLHEYEESPPIYGYDYHAGPEHHGFDHHGPDHYHGHHGGHHDIGYHHKHYDHGLAAKAFLWPIAGIALLGAAAALVSNPVLLQLGVVSGRRKRRDTEEIFDTQGPELSWLKKKHEEHEDSILKRRYVKKNTQTGTDRIDFKYKDVYRDDELQHSVPGKKYSVKQEALFKKLRVHPTVQSPVEIAADNPRRMVGGKLVPVPLILKEKASN